MSVCVCASPRQAAIGSTAVAESSRLVLVLETVTVLVLSVLVTQFATQVFAEMLAEEGFDAQPRVAEPQAQPVDSQ